MPGLTQRGHDPEKARRLVDDRRVFCLLDLGPVLGRLVVDVGYALGIGLFVDSLEVEVGFLLFKLGSPPMIQPGRLFIQSSDLAVSAAYGRVETGSGRRLADAFNGAGLLRGVEVDVADLDQRFQSLGGLSVALTLVLRHLRGIVQAGLQPVRFAQLTG
ncbi:hypothetical protein D3C84_762700 [compost metagenome]